MEEKVSLPIKTKIAAWWMIMINGAVVSYGFWVLSQILFTPYLTEALRYQFIRRIIDPLSRLWLPFLLVFLGIFILKRKKWVWYFTIIVLSLGIILFLIPPYEFEFPSIINIIIPLLLLLLDRKNFFKVAR